MTQNKLETHVIKLELKEKPNVAYKWLRVVKMDESL